MPSGEAARRPSRRSSGAAGSRTASRSSGTRARGSPSMTRSGSSRRRPRSSKTRGVMRRVGESALDLSVGDGLKAALRALGTPGLVYRNVVRANAKFSTVQGMELVELGPRPRARAVRRPRRSRLPPARLRLHGRPALVRARSVRPAARAASRTPSAGSPGGGLRLRHLMEQALLAAAHAARGRRRRAFSPSAAPPCSRPRSCPRDSELPPSLGGASAWRMRRATRSRWDQLEREAREHLELGDRLAASLQDLAGELRLEELLEKITRNAQSAVGGKEYALLVEEDGHHRCLGSSGLAGVHDRRARAMARAARGPPHRAGADRRRRPGEPSWRRLRCRSRCRSARSAPCRSPTAVETLGRARGARAAAPHVPAPRRRPASLLRGAGRDRARERAPVRGAGAACRA